MQKCGLKYVMFTFRRRIGGSTSERLNEDRNEIREPVTPLYYFQEEDRRIYF
jgi:hypothetical protein